MATIGQGSLFSWDMVDQSSEILRVKRVLDVLPDEQLIRTLIKERKGKRDDYPIEAVWNSLIAGVVVGHEGVASLIRELKRNAELREVCGFAPLAGEKAVPNDSVYSRLFVKLFQHQALVEEMFERLVTRLTELLDDFGLELGIDGKALPTHGRQDQDADVGVKTYKGVKKDGAPYEKVKTWFGYRLHLICDVNYELPVAFEVTKASVAESPKLISMVEDVEAKHPELLERTKSLAGDRGYDDGADKAELYDDYRITPLIDTRDLFSGKPAGPMRPLDEQSHDTIYYGPTGEVCCKVDPFAKDEDQRYVPMQFMGYEADRQSLKFRCPAAAYGIECKNRAACQCPFRVRDGEYGRVVRVPLERDRRLFMPTHRHSRNFEQGYNKRNAVERVNSRIDQVYGFEHHYIRGLKKMKLRMSLALIVMLATAVAWVEAGRKENARSLLTAA